MRDSCPAAFRNFDDRSSVDVSFTSGGIPYISRSCSVSGRCITHFRLFEDGLFGGIKRCSQSLIGLWLIFIGLPSIGLDFRLSPPIQSKFPITFILFKPKGCVSQPITTYHLLFVRRPLSSLFSADQTCSSNLSRPSHLKKRFIDSNSRPLSPPFISFIICFRLQLTLRATAVGNKAPTPPSILVSVLCYRLLICVIGFQQNPRIHKSQLL